MRFKTSNLRESCHTELVSCVGWASPDDVYSVADDHQILRWNLVSAETQKVKFYKNIAKGTTDPRVEFISQDQSSQILNNFRISIKH